MKEFPKAAVKALLLAALSGKPPPPPTTVPKRNSAEATLKQRRTYTGRRRLARGGRSYRVLNERGYLRHKRGSWTRYMVECILQQTNTANVNIDATIWPGKKVTAVDFDWVAKQGYITFEVQTDD